VAVAAAAGFGVFVASGIADTRLRAENLLLLAALVVACWGGHRFLPVADRAAGTVRAGGYILLAGFAVQLAGGFRTGPGQRGPTTVDTGAILIYATVAAVYALAVLAVTQPRSPLSGRRLATAAGTGALAGLCWLTGTLTHPPIPADCAGALMLSLIAGAAAAALPATGTARQRAAAALCAAATTALLIVVAANGLLELSPRWVPDVVHTLPPGTTPAQRLVENRTEAPDPYVGLMLYGLLLAAALTATLPTRRHPQPAPVLAAAPS
jgi:hypothetical protein